MVDDVRLTLLFTYFNFDLFYFFNIIEKMVKANLKSEIRKFLRKDS